MTRFVLLALAATACTACGTVKHAGPPHEPNLVIFHHVDDARGERVAGARVRACQGEPTIHPKASQVIAQTFSAWNGEFLIETDPAHTDFLVIDHAGLYAIITRPWSHMPHIVLRHPSAIARKPSNQALQPPLAVPMSSFYMTSTFNCVAKLAPASDG